MQSAVARRTTDLNNIRSLMHLLVVMLLGQQLNDGLGQLHLLVLLLSQSGPHNGEHQHPQLIAHLRVSMGNSLREATLLLTFSCPARYRSNAGLFYQHKW